MKKIKIFVYGSLINEKNLKKAINNVTNIFPCRLYGFIRVFNVESSNNLNENGEKITVLNIEKSEFNQYVNGICFDINFDDFDKFQKKEKKYELVQVEVTDFESNKNTYRAFVFRSIHFEAYNYKFESKAQKEYLDICLSGCDKFGKDFLEEFKKTTFIGNRVISDLEEKGILK